jgi:hypothetical protein
MGVANLPTCAQCGKRVRRVLVDDVSRADRMEKHTVHYVCDCFNGPDVSPGALPNRP